MAPKGSLNAKPKPIFQNVVIATAGDLGAEMSEPNLMKWLRNFGGRLSADFDETVTHLIATNEQFKKQGKKVKKAMHNKIDILQPDWLEDSMTNNKKLAPNRYSHIKIRKAENEKKRRSEQKQKGIKQGESYINSNKYHIYMDSTGFSYQVTLTREEGERFIVELWESNSKPHLYYAAVKYHKKARARGIPYRPSETPGNLNRELKIFRLTFLKKTGVHWDDRLKKADANNGIVTGSGEGKHGGYRYEMPAKGKPAGLVDSKDRDGVRLNNHDGDKSTATIAPGAIHSFGNGSKDNDYDAQAEHLLLTQVRDFTYDLGATVLKTQQDATEDVSTGKQSVPTPPATPKKTRIVLVGQKKPPPSGQVAVAATNAKPASVTNADGTQSALQKTTGSDIPGTFHQRSKGAFNMRNTGAAQKVLAARNRPVDEKKLLKAKVKAAVTNTRNKANYSDIDMPAPSRRQRDFDSDIEMDDALDGAKAAFMRGFQDSDAETDSSSEDSPLESPHVDKADGIEQMIEQDSSDDLEEQMTDSEEEQDSGYDD